VKLFTFIQVALASIIFGVAQFASIGYIFPALVCACVPIRQYVLTRIFTEEDLKHLDPFGESEEEFENEKREKYDSDLKNREFDPASLASPGLTDFHGGAKKKV
jgi:hypothetical protein